MIWTMKVAYCADSVNLKTSSLETMKLEKTTRWRVLSSKRLGTEWAKLTFCVDWAIWSHGSTITNRHDKTIFRLRSFSEKNLRPLAKPRSYEAWATWKS